MSRSVINCAEVLKFLQKAKPHYRKAVLQKADKELVICICECVYNILKGKVPLTNTQKQNICKHKRLLRRLVKRGEPFTEKRKIIYQKGGSFLPMLLAPIISGVLGSLFK